MRRCSHVTGGVRTNVMRMARLRGTRITCAQYRTATMRTLPANLSHPSR
jgi:hypothetical protein